MRVSVNAIVDVRESVNTKFAERARCGRLGTVGCEREIFLRVGRTVDFQFVEARLGARRCVNRKADVSGFDRGEFLDIVPGMDGRPERRSGIRGPHSHGAVEHAKREEKATEGDDHGDGSLSQKTPEASAWWQNPPIGG